MTRKPTTKSPEERRLRKEIRRLLHIYKSGQLTEDATVREFLDVIEDEVRRARMSMAPVVFADNGPRNATRADLPSFVKSRDLHISVAPPKAWKEWADKVTSGGK